MHVDVCLEETIMSEIVRQFPISTIQYACVSTDHFQSTPIIIIPFRMIYIQIILTKVINKHGWFLDRVAGTRLLHFIIDLNVGLISIFLGVQCNYHVTDNDLAWNEFIRRGENDLLSTAFIHSITACSSSI